MAEAVLIRRESDLDLELGNLLGTVLDLGCGAGVHHADRPCLELLFFVLVKDSTGQHEFRVHRRATVGGYAGLELVGLHGHEAVVKVSGHVRGQLERAATGTARALLCDHASALLRDLDDLGLLFKGADAPDRARLGAELHDELAHLVFGKDGRFDCHLNSIRL